MFSMPRASRKKVYDLGESICLIRISEILDDAGALPLVEKVESKRRLPLNPSWLSVCRSGHARVFMSPDKEWCSIHSQNAGVLAQVITAVLRRANSALQQWKQR